MQKPVWRLNTGNGVPSDLGDRSIYGDGEVLITSALDRVDHEIWELDKIAEYLIYAYETNRTKPAKYR